MAKKHKIGKYSQKPVSNSLNSVYPIAAVVVILAIVYTVWNPSPKKETTLSASSDTANDIIKQKYSKKTSPKQRSSRDTTSGYSTNITKLWLEAEASMNMLQTESSEVTRVHSSPGIFVHANLLDESECNHLVALLDERLAESREHPEHDRWCFAEGTKMSAKHTDIEFEKDQAIGSECVESREIGQRLVGEIKVGREPVAVGVARGQDTIVDRISAKLETALGFDQVQKQKEQYEFNRHHAL
jgi:hypothetical protein